jgi:hypothetical protein
VIRAEADQIKEAVEKLHGGTATLAQSVPIRESRLEGSTKRRFFAVLHQPPVDSPQAAVRAAIVAENRHGTPASRG